MSATTITDEQYHEAARANYNVNVNGILLDELESADGNLAATDVVDRVGGGAWVHAWLFVSDDDVTTEGR